MASHKKVIVRQFDGSLWRGYLPASHILSEHKIQLLDLSGRVQPIPIEVVKSIAYVKDFNADDASEPERLGSKSFRVRPRGAGLLLKLEYRDRDTIEGLASADLNFFDDLIEDRCVGIVPPDLRSNTYRLLIPRSALSRIEIVSLASPSPRKPPKNDRSLQERLFESGSERGTLAVESRHETAANSG